MTYYSETMDHSKIYVVQISKRVFSATLLRKSKLYFDIPKNYSIFQIKYSRISKLVE